MFLRIGVGGLAVAVAWYVGLRVVFGSAQRWLANPDLQSDKFLAVFTRIEPLPRMAESSAVLIGGLVVVGLFVAAAYALVSPGMTGSPWRRGSRFGLVAWLLMVPWFEFYLPWNVMHEPAILVALEMVLWGVVLQGVGLAVATAFAVLARPAAGSHPDAGMTAS